MVRTSDLIKNFNWTIAICVVFGIISLFLLIDTSMTIAFLGNSGSITSDSLKAASITFLIASLGGIALSIGGLVLFVKYNNKVLDTNTSAPVIAHSVEMTSLPQSSQYSNMLI
jgi:hypothetical protein